MDWTSLLCENRCECASPPHPLRTFHQWMTLCVIVGRTMRRLSLKCMKCMQWMCSSALERGRWDNQNVKVFLSFLFFFKPAVFKATLCVWIKQNNKMLCVANQAKDGGLRTTVYKRDPDKVYGLKMKTSRTFFSEMERRFDKMAFTLRYFIYIFCPIRCTELPMV